MGRLQGRNPVMKRYYFSVAHVLTKHFKGGSQEMDRGYMNFGSNRHELGWPELAAH